MESPQSKKRNDKCDDINSDTAEDKTILEHDQEIEIRFDDRKSVEVQKNYKCEEINSYTTFRSLDEKVIFDDNKSVQTQRNYNIELELYDLEKIDKDVYKLTDTLDDENKANNLESIKTNREKETFRSEDEKVIFDDNKSVQTQRNDNSKLELYDLENIDKDVYELTDTLDDENKVNNLESTETNLNLDIFEKWMVKIFPPLKLDFMKLSNYSEDENISNEAIYARLIIILILITVVLCFITFGQLIWISVLSRGPIAVQPFIPKINNPFCK
jgi:hypothetical protein